MWYWVSQSICYNILWFLCITFPQSHNYKKLVISSILLIIQLCLIRNTTSLDSLMMLSLFIGGNLVAALLIMFKQFFYTPRSYLPLWLIFIWASFTLYTYPLLKLYKYHFFEIALIIFFGFIAVYYIAIAQKAIFAKNNKTAALLWAGVSHALFFAFISFFYTKVNI